MSVDMSKAHLLGHLTDALSREDKSFVVNFMRLIRYADKALLEEILVVLDDPETRQAVIMRDQIDALGMTVDRYVDAVRTIENFPWPPLDN